MLWMSCLYLLKISKYHCQPSSCVVSRDLCVSLLRRGSRSPSTIFKISSWLIRYGFGFFLWAENAQKFTDVSTDICWIDMAIYVKKDLVAVQFSALFIGKFSQSKKIKLIKRKSLLLA